MVLFTGLGGIAGVIVRFYMGKRIVARGTKWYPLGTGFINISGSLLLGILFSLYTQGLVAPWLWLLLGPGFCGAYTTFSTFGYEIVQLIDQKRLGDAVVYMLFSVIFGVMFAWLGMKIMAYMTN
ncbi:fluoride efflux transporter CrcB [Cohnella laeviribosi]|nr:fluoride efflux transporter CrcB [Cohnella laeviribosi]